MHVTIYHNHNCSNSRKALEIIRAKGIEPEIIEYLKTPLSRHEIAALVKQMNVPVRAVMRKKEALYSKLKLEKADDDTLLEAMVMHPILLNRPIVTTPKGTKLCRPSETVAGIL